MQKWVSNSQPVAFWISGFFFIQSFITAIKQNFARRYTIPINFIQFEFEFLNLDERKISIKPTEGAYIYGLYLEGARWSHDAESLKESNPKIMFDYLPVIWLKAIQLTKQDYEPNKFECPVYRTSLRHGELSSVGISTNFVFNIEFPTKKDKAHWINRGLYNYILDILLNHFSKTIILALKE